MGIQFIHRPLFMKNELWCSSFSIFSGHLFSKYMVHYFVLFFQRAERLQQDLEGKRHSRLFFYNDIGEISLVQSLKELIKTVDALIYVVNTSSDWKGKKYFEVCLYKTNIQKIQ